MDLSLSEEQQARTSGDGPRGVTSQIQKLLIGRAETGISAFG